MGKGWAGSVSVRSDSTIGLDWPKHDRQQRGALSSQTTLTVHGMFKANRLSSPEWRANGTRMGELHEGDTRMDKAKVRR